jgi:hypothetical protein
MTEDEVRRRLNLIRYGGVVITVTVFVALLAFAIVIGNAMNNPGIWINALLLYIIGFTIFAAVLSIVAWFAYRAVLMSRVTKAS